MDLKELGRNWTEFGAKDPFWAVLTDPEKSGNRWDPKEFYESGRDHVEAERLFVLSLGMRLGGELALDFGCGPGRLTQALAQYFDRVYGVDIAPSMLEIARANNAAGEKCEFVCNDTPDLKQFDDNSFDFVYTFIVLQHMEPRFAKAYIAEFMRVLKPGGLLVFQVPERLMAPMPELPASVPSSEPVMEMYAVPRIEVEEIISSSGRAIAIVPDTHAGHNWAGLRYYVVKS